MSAKAYLVVALQQLAMSGIALKENATVTAGALLALAILSFIFCFITISPRASDNKEQS